MIKAIAISLIAIVVASPALAAGNAEAGKSKAQVCFACHGPEGNKPIANYPKLAGQNAGYLLKQLKAFKSGMRDNPTMKSQVANLQPQDMEDLAAYFSQQKRSLDTPTDKKLVELGQRLYRGGNESRHLPACMACHSPDGSGNVPANYPSLGGQSAAYVSKTLTDFHSGARGMAPKDSAGKIMHDIAKMMDEKDIKAVAQYVSGLH